MREAAALEGKRADSPASTIGSINNGRSNPSPFQNGQTPMISRPTLDPSVQAEDLEPPRKLGQSDEWGRYFNNNNTVENLYPGPAPESHATEAALGGAALGAAVGAGFAATAGARNTHMTVGSEYTIDSPTSSHFLCSQRATGSDPSSRACYTRWRFSVGPTGRRRADRPRRGQRQLLPLLLLSKS